MRTTRSLIWTGQNSDKMVLHEFIRRISTCLKYHFFILAPQLME